MGKRVLWTMAIAALLVSAGLTSVVMAEEGMEMMTEEAEVVGNTVCPVTGNVIVEPGEYTVAYDGKIYNLCSSGCEETFMSDPDTYAAIAEAQAMEADDPAMMTEEEDVMMTEEEGGAGMEKASTCE
jgi:YHS domain-containing protein